MGGGRGGGREIILGARADAVLLAGRGMDETVRGRGGSEGATGGLEGAVSDDADD
jgi:hypothetical protein